ncbi:MAG TPA: DUF2147 domain-containing protein [Burkholderiales bacterium]|nr:DUF2147 domain-containing protein [Burkholderiales bacterium]
MRTSLFPCAFGCLLLVAATAASAADPAGTWLTIDDETGKERSIVRIEEVNGELQGMVEKLFDQPGDDPQHLCRKCTGERKDRPIVGMTILWGLKKKGDDWSGGEILDPMNGKTYRCKMTLSEDGQKLDVRGYIGISLIGRTQTWHRAQ